MTEDEIRKLMNCPRCSYRSIREGQEAKEEDMITHIKREHIELMYAGGIE